MSVIERARRTAPGEKNVGGAERVARLAIGFALLLSGVALLASGDASVTSDPLVRTVIAVVAALAGARLLWTGYTQKCRLNRRLGRNTYRE
jgi:hypothetical protein